MSPVSMMDPPSTGASPAETEDLIRVPAPPEVDPQEVVDAMPQFPVRPITVDQFEYLVNVGFFGDAKVEMLDGFAVNKMTHGSLASMIIAILAQILTRAISDSCLVRVQLPVQCSRSQPEPDITVVVGPSLLYRDSHPKPPDILLIVEVSDSTLAKDRGPKFRSYASEMIREYWIVNCVDRQIEIYTEPSTANGQPRYTIKSVLTIGETASLRIEGQPPIEIPLATLFGE